MIMRHLPALCSIYPQGTEVNSVQLTCLVLASPIILMSIWKPLESPWSLLEDTCWLRLANAFAVLSIARSISSLPPQNTAVGGTEYVGNLTDQLRTGKARTQSQPTSSRKGKGGDNWVWRAEGCGHVTSSVFLCTDGGVADNLQIETFCSHFVQKEGVAHLHCLGGYFLLLMEWRLRSMLTFVLFWLVCYLLQLLCKAQMWTWKTGLVGTRLDDCMPTVF